MEYQTKQIVTRMMDAYSVKTMAELGEKLDLGNGTVNTWIKRNFFPGKEIIQCVFDTGANLNWLVKGEGSIFEDVFEKTKETLILFNHFELIQGKLNDIGSKIFDRSIFKEELLDPILILNDNQHYVIERNFSNQMSGLFLIEISEIMSIAHLTKMPGNKWRVGDVDWPDNEINLKGKVVAIINLT